MILADSQIRELCLKEGMIEPFAESTKGKGIISYGLSSYGYDMRLGGSFKVFHDLNTSIVDPKNFDNNLLNNIYIPKNEDKNWIIMPPRSFALGVSVEKFNLPVDVMGIVLGKSTYARCSLIVNCTPLESGWQGYLTIELVNSSPCPLKVYAYEGIAQIIFFKGEIPCETTYAMKNGKYQNQLEDITLPKVEK